MKSEKSLEDKIKDIDEKMPGMKKSLEYSSSDSWGFGSSYQTDDVEYFETEKYHVGAAKRIHMSWSDDSPVFDWYEYAVLYYKPKDGDEKIKAIRGVEIKTRGGSDSRYDSPLKGKYPYVGLEHNGKFDGKDQFLLYWADAEGKHTHETELRIKIPKEESK